MSDSVCQCCAAVEEMREHWKLIDCIKGGTSAMREAGEAYLPKRQLETREDYEARLRLATLHPAFEETVGAMVGRVFAKPVVIGDDVPQEIADLLTDVDTEGR
ncbi:TPA: DNA-binding protein, partial [Pseudomonas aeruginosa]|nr:DNA-binding protein [Pseudomonas aeruginosa]